MIARATWATWIAWIAWVAWISGIGWGWNDLVSCWVNFWNWVSVIDGNIVKHEQDDLN